MTTGSRVVFTGPGSAEMESFEIPSPGRYQVLVRTLSSVVSAGTELTSLLGQLSVHQGYPLYPGYSNVGVVEAVGDGVERPSVGQRVLSMGPHSSHHILDLSEKRPGGPAYWEPVPDAMASEEAAFTILGSVALHGVRRAHLQVGEAAAVFGEGVVGQLTTQLVRRSGCHPIIAIDMIEDRLERAAQSGATVLVNPEKQEPVGAIMAATGGRGADALFEATRAGTALPVMLRAAARNARLLVVGSIPGKIEIDPFTDLQLKEVQIIGCFQPAAPLYGHAYYPWTQALNRRVFLDMLARGEVGVQHLITHRVPAHGAAKAYTMVAKGRRGWLGIVIDWETA